MHLSLTYVLIDLRYAARMLPPPHLVLIKHHCNNNYIFEKLRSCRSTGRNENILRTFLRSRCYSIHSLSCKSEETFTLHPLCLVINAVIVVGKKFHFNCDG